MYRTALKLIQYLKTHILQSLLSFPYRALLWSLQHVNPLIPTEKPGDLKSNHIGQFFYFIVFTHR